MTSKAQLRRGRAVIEDFIAKKQSEIASLNERVVEAKMYVEALRDIINIFGKT